MLLPHVRSAGLKSLDRYRDLEQRTYPVVACAHFLRKLTEKVNKVNFLLSSYPDTEGDPVIMFSTKS
jgi:hypothetical protein